jgi:Fic family protein
VRIPFILGDNAMTFVLSSLPPSVDLESKAILKKAASAHRYLAELKGISESIPNQGILINTLSLQEAKDSSAVENIITTNDDLYREGLFPEYTSNASAKEVHNYVAALRTGYDRVQKDNLLTTNHILEIQGVLENNNAGLRKLPGTGLKNIQTGEIVYTPPQNYSDIVALMNNLERFINDEDFYVADALVKMAMIHYQFESIHPFYDGNGRTGRIINVLYLVQKQLLNIPVLYLSRYIVRTKTDYYRLLQHVRDTGDWETWVLYMLEGVEQTSRQTIGMVQAIGAALLDYKHRIRNTQKFYSQDLINNLFYHPYTKIEFLQKSLDVSRVTATKYLDLLTQGGFLTKKKIGRSNYYVNKALFKILTDQSTE